ncbi:MAG: SH3 domain-containing protein [Bdellovibrionales bacterium]|jgi:hypothetical protein|nr:SH3 domain-containing protein [Bdellovibrionales bacterium]
MSKFLARPFLVVIHIGVVAPIVATVLSVFAPIPSMAQTASQSIDTPAFLRPDSRFPSSGFKRDWLETRTTENQIQRWFRVTFDGKYGWIPEDHALTGLKLSAIARTVREEPDRTAPALDALSGKRIAKDTQVVILEIRGSWTRIRSLGDEALNSNRPRDSWVLNEALARDPGNQIERGLTFVPSQLFPGPNSTLRPIDRIDAFKQISVLKTVNGESGQWLEIQVNKSTAWIERSKVWLAEDLASSEQEKFGSVRATLQGLELRSAPMPNANVVQTLDGTERLTIIGSRYLRWGKIRAPQHGWLWWPITDDHLDDPGFIPPVKLTSQDLRSRRVYDTARSRAVPGLRFASAQGIFMSRDGKEWSLISKFGDKNYPLSVANNGHLFVGPYLSTDNGENFEQWIRWDRLVETLKRETGKPPAQLRLSKLKALDGEGLTLQLLMDVGHGKPLRILTKDRGQSWSLPGSRSSSL